MFKKFAHALFAEYKDILQHSYILREEQEGRTLNILSLPSLGFCPFLAPQEE